MSAEALRQYRRFAERCDYREGRCKSCRLVLRLVAEVERLTAPLEEP